MASLGALGYLVVSAAIGFSLLSTPSELDTREAAQRAPSSPGRGVEAPDDTGLTSDPSASSSAPTSGPPANERPPSGYQYVTGPYGLRTVIPSGWRPIRVTGAMQAADPADHNRYVRYGGAPAPKQNIDSSHVKEEHSFAKRSTGYRRIELHTATYGGHQAVEWEYEHQDGRQTIHVRTLYWRVGGIEYFLLASSPAAGWSRMRSVYDAMVAKAMP